MTTLLTSYGICLLLSGALFGIQDGWTDLVHRFLVNRDGTVTDTKTGLIWEKKVALDGVEDPRNLHDADNRYAWAGKCIGRARRGPCPTAHLCDAHEWREFDMVWCQPTAAAAAACPKGLNGCPECVSEDGPCVLGPPGNSVSTVWEWLARLNANKFAGHDDWRLPTADELRALADAGVRYKWTTPDFNPPFIDIAFHSTRCKAHCRDIRDPECSCTAGASDGRHDWYWTATVSGNDPLNTGAVGFSQTAGAEDAMARLFVRAVRNDSVR